MSRIVLDTNVLLALWIFRDPSVAPLREALARGELVPVRSVATDAEVREVLSRPGLFTVPPAQQASLLADWEAQALLVEAIRPVAFQCRDPLDQKFLELAVTAGARWLVTRDRKLLKLRRKARLQNLAILTPETFATERLALTGGAVDSPATAARPGTRTGPGTGI